MIDHLRALLDEALALAMAGEAIPVDGLEAALAECELDKYTADELCRTARLFDGMGQKTIGRVIRRAVRAARTAR